MTKKKYDPLKGVNTTTQMLMTESIGYGVAGKIAGATGDATALKAFGTGSSLAGVPSLVHGAGNVVNSLGMLTPKKRKHKRR